MKLVARILIILFLNQLSVYGETILQNINSTAGNGICSEEILSASNLQNDEMEQDGNIFSKNISDLEVWETPLQNPNLTRGDALRIVLGNKQVEIRDVSNIPDRLEIERGATAPPLVNLEIDTNSQPIEEEDFKHETIQPEEGTIISNTSRQISIQNNNKIANQKLSTGLDGNVLVSETQTMLPKDLPVLAESQIDTVDKFKIFSLSSNVTKDLLISKVHVSKQHNGNNNFNQSWTENHVKTINEYRIAKKSFSSNKITQNSKLAESDLIEIVLKEAINSSKNPKYNNLNPETASSNSYSFEIYPFNTTKNVLTEKTLKEAGTFTTERNKDAAEATNNIKGVSILLKNSEGIQNHIADDNRYGEKAVSSNEATIELTPTASERDPEFYEKPRVLNVTKNGPELFDIEGIRNMNETPEETTPSSLENSFTLETDLPDADPLTSRTTSDVKRPHTFNEPANGLGMVAFNEGNQTQDKYLILTKFFEEINVSPIAHNELSQRLLNHSKHQQNTNQTENQLDYNAPSLSKEQENLYLNSLQSSAKRNTIANAWTPTPVNTFEESKNSPGTQNELKEAVLQEITHLNTTGNENNFNPVQVLFPIAATNLTQKPLESEKYDELKKKALVEASILSAKELYPNPLNSIEKPQNFNKTEEDLQSVTSSSNKVTDLGPTEPLVELTISSNIKPIPDPLNIFEEPKNYITTEGNAAVPENQQQPTASASFSLEEADEKESSSKPLISLEEYAVKQMNFVLDHLLLETQKFVANVLQATINSVFPRDRLKHYAEGVNQVLNPIIESDYSDEIVDNIKIDDQDDLYEQIIEKLNFLKNKPSKYLQKQIPPEWLNEFLDKRLELAIWLDKAAEQMHKEFTGYITEEEDPIKYQYFNETFDDISRATEIHHKLALLADLVKIIKNKKQITFMDLYMQT